MAGARTIALVFAELRYGTCRLGGTTAMIRLAIAAQTMSAIVYREVKKDQKAGKVRWVGRVDDEALPLLLLECCAMIPGSSLSLSRALDHPDLVLSHVHLTAEAMLGDGIAENETELLE